MRPTPFGNHPSSRDDRPFSRGMRVEMGSACLLFLSGIAAVGDDGTPVCVGDIAGQTAVVLDRMERLLREEGASLADVAKVTIFLKNIDDYAAMNAVRARYFPRNPPASSAVEARMIRDEFLVEIEAVAAVPRGTA